MPRESVLQRKLALGELLDIPSFNEVVKGFVELYRIGIKVFDDKGGKIADIKIGNGDFCGYVFSFPEGRARCTKQVGRVKDGPLAITQGARLPILDDGPPIPGLIASPCFTGLRYLMLPIMFEGDQLGRVVFGPFLPQELKGFPDSLKDVSAQLDLGRAQELVEKVRRAPESTVARVMAHFAQVLDTLVLQGQKMLLTSQLHIESTLVQNRELEERNQKLAEGNVKLKELDRLKSAFLATVSHELRTPLTSIIGYSEMLAEGLAGPMSSEQSDYVRTIMDKGETLLKLISSILDISQIEAGRVRLNFETSDIIEVIQSSASSVRPQASKKGITLDVQVPPAPVMAAADRDRLRQVVVNLLANAVKFTPTNGRIGLLLSPVGQQPELGKSGYRISVEDSGVGIAEDQHSKIFQSFYQVDSSSTREFGGAGLGLAIVKSFVEGHGGVVMVSSEPGRGARFTAVLPEKAIVMQASIVPPIPAAPADDRF